MMKSVLVGFFTAGCLAALAAGAAPAQERPADAAPAGPCTQPAGGPPCGRKLHLWTIDRVLDQLPERKRRVTVTGNLQQIVASTLMDCYKKSDDLGGDCNQERWFFKLRSPTGRTLVLRTSTQGRLLDWRMPSALPPNCVSSSTDVQNPAIAFTGYLAEKSVGEDGRSLIVERTCRLEPSH